MGITESLLYMLLPSDGGQTGYDEALHRLLDEKKSLRTIQITQDYTFELCLWFIDCQKNQNNFGVPQVEFGGFAAGVTDARDISGQATSYSFLVRVSSVFPLMGILRKNNDIIYATALIANVDSNVRSYMSTNSYGVATQLLPGSAGEIQYFYPAISDKALESAAITTFTKFDPVIDPWDGTCDGTFDMDFAFDYMLSYQRYHAGDGTEAVPVIYPWGDRITISDTFTWNTSNKILPASSGSNLTDLNSEQLYNAVLDFIYQLNAEHNISTVPPRFLYPAT